MKKEVVVFIDIETRSKCNLKTCGAYVYSLHESTDILCLAYKFSNSKIVHVWTPDNFGNKKALEKLKKFRGSIVAHNYKFEYSIIVNVLCKKYKWPKHFIKPLRYRCTMATAYRYGLPGKLDTVAQMLKLKNQKMAGEGLKLINKYSVPYKDRKTKEILFRNINAPENIKDQKLLVEYNKQDIRVTEEIYNKLPKLHLDKFEWPIFQLDGLINEQGLRIDLVNLKKLINSYKKYFKLAEIEAEKLAGHEESGTLTIKSSIGFKNWINKQWVNKRNKTIYIDNVQQFTLNNFSKELKNIEGGFHICQKARNIIKAIKIRRVLSAAAPKKLNAMLNTSDDEGIVKGSIQYGVAQTLRWAGRGFQPQNLPRMSSENFTKDVKTLQKLEIPLENSVDKINELLRQLIIPRKGNSFLIGDFAAIEARVLFWLAGCKTGLEQYRKGLDIYSEFARSIYTSYIEIGKELIGVSKNQRFVGKTSILGLGYGMGVDRFFETCKNFGIDINYSIAQKAVNQYRKVYREVPKFWRIVEKLFIEAIQYGEIEIKGYLIPGTKCFIEFEKTGQTVSIKFPSGRKQYYFHPFIKDNSIRFWHKSKKLSVMWGGVIVENIVQGIARDLLAEALIYCKKSGLMPVLTVHDEILIECDTRDVKKKLKHFKRIMTTPPPWAEGLPLGAECVSSKRYKKI